MSKPDPFDEEQVTDAVTAYLLMHPVCDLCDEPSEDARLIWPAGGGFRHLALCLRHGAEMRAAEKRLGIDF